MDWRSEIILVHKLERQLWDYLHLVAGVDRACIDAYRRMLDRKFRLKSLSISMPKPNEPGYSRPDVYVIEDRR